MFDIDLSELEHKVEEKKVRPTVLGRTVHIDADFLAYQVSADDEKSVEEMKHNTHVAVEKMRLMSGSEFVMLHLTPKGSDKGGRYDLAITKEYQANRKDKPKPKFLNIIREWMHKELGAKLHMDIEADDGMAIAQYDAIKAGNGHLSVIATKDKDLCQVPGIQLNWDTGELTDLLDPFGYIVLDDSKSTKKIKGRGTKYFWAQMLTGDPADNIAGLPKCHLPQFIKNKPKAVGPVLAFDILKDVKNDKEAFALVRDLYKAHCEGEGFFHWKTGEKIPYGQVLVSEAKLLWMRRTKDENDVVMWMKEVCL